MTGPATEAGTVTGTAAETGARRGTAAGAGINTGNRRERDLKDQKITLELMRKHTLQSRITTKHLLWIPINFISLEVFSLRFPSKLYILEFKYLPIFIQNGVADVIKRPISKKKSSADYSANFYGGRQTDIELGAENFASLSRDF